MDELRQYYNEQIKCEGLPEFDNITPEFSKSIFNSLGFKTYMAVKSMYKLRDAIIVSFRMN
jgi:hypothetical protein